MIDPTPREAELFRLRRRLRNHDALYGSHGEAKELQCERLMKKISARLTRYFSEAHADRMHAFGQRLLYTYA